MATRYLQTDFWSDSKIHDKTSQLERYLMLYFMTNPHTNQTGCYEIPLSTIKFETGIEDEQNLKDLINKLSALNLCTYDFESQEVLINNWYKFNWTSSIKVKKCILKEIEKIKSDKFKDYINMVCIPYSYPDDRVSGKKRKEKERKENKEEVKEENVYQLLENEFGRTISPIEYEIINEWDYNIEIILLAIKEAVLNNARSIKYIDKVLYNWAQQGFKTKEDVENYLKKRKQNEDADSSIQYGEF